MTKFAKFIEESKIDPRRVIAASRLLERLTQEDRMFLAEAARKRSLAGKKDSAKKGETKKLHSNRPVTPSLIDAAKAGKPVSGPAKNRLVRAINRILEQKKQSAIELRTLF
jgi:hypothetical protein